MTKFEASDKPSYVLAYEAAIEALKDADIPFSKIDAVVTASLEWFFSVEKQRHFPAMMSSMFRTHKPIISVPAGCAGGGHALWVANQLGYDNVLVLGVEKLMTCKSESITDEFTMALESKWEQLEGLTAPGSAALLAGHYFNRFPIANTDDLALIAYKNHLNGALNPKARFFGKKVSLDDIKNSKIACSPLRVMDCSISVDGAAACVITKDKTEVKIAGSGLCTDRIAPFESKDLTTWEATSVSSAEAYKQAGISPSDIDFAELHDAFTIVELISYEDLGFVPKGSGVKMIRDGTVLLDGKLPINPSGGLKAKGHPPSATGLSQIYSLTQQIRREAGDLQVKNSKIGLAHNIGGVGGTVTCHILKKV
ncbi:MAG: thiolase family protein [Nanoarchaeota archaeon]|nr:thiolase family protein [Nanoarchaeota archaeon]MBU1946186.1 thiolase family protein [Nanoarchaeota archaeon]